MPTICLIAGDGVGQEVVPAAADAIAAALPSAHFVTAEAGWDCFMRRGDALPPETLAAVQTADATLFGATQSPTTGAPAPGSQSQVPNPQPPIPSPQPPTYRSPILALRRHFDLYANLRPAKSLLPGAPPIDLLIVRENTEGLYSGRECRTGDTAIAERVITGMASERIARVAFEQARRRARPGARVTIVHKANVLKVTDGLFRESCLAVARDYPDVEAEEMLVDAAAMWLVRDPGRFDVIVTTNLFGDILSDLAAGLIGGLGVAPSANMGAGPVAVFEPVHGSAPDIAGTGAANPIGALLSGALLLDHLGEAAAASRVRAAVQQTVDDGVCTPDLGGRATTSEVTEAVCRDIREGADRTSAS